MINLEEKYLNILKSILSRYSSYNFYLFGSRITASIKPFFDIDLLYFDSIPNKEIMELEEALEESNIPYKVDLVEYNKCADEFKKIIGDNYICITPSK